MQHQIAPSKSIMKSRFENQVAVITGGANGLGKAIGMRIASEGGRIVIFDRVEDDCRSAVEEFTSNGYHTSFECVDVSKEPDIESAMKATKRLAAMAKSKAAETWASKPAARPETKAATATQTSASASQTSRKRNQGPG